MVLRFIYSVLLLCLLLLTCDHGDAVKDLKEKHCDEEEGKTSSLSSYIARLESKYKPSYVVYETDEKIARLESKYKPDYGVDETEGKSSSPSSYIAHLESKYKPGYVVDEVDEKIACLESKYKPGYGVDEIEKKSSSPSSYIARLESKYKAGYVVDEAEEKIARLESRYKPGYGVDEAKEKSSFQSSYITRLENKYKPGYVADETAEKSSSLRSYITDLGSKYKPGYIDDQAEEKSLSQPSSKMMEHHSMENHGDDDIGSEEVGVFTIDDVRAFHVGRKLSTFFSIRNPSLYPGFLPREMADSIPFSSSETSKILQFFSVSPESPKGKAIKDTLRRCEIEPAKGETKICSTSSESMLEFLKNAFGEANFKLISTSHPTMTTPILQSYTILEPPREIESPKKVACHPLQYLYAIYMCHYDATETKIFKVPLVGDNGDKVDALIVCHMDTSAWSPKHTAFSLLGTKPGIPVCHAFSEGHGVWIESSIPVATI
ncbi:PREDICTED: uncharacterized protein LOC18601917 [Theobroma cacao]|uniref:Uncharacterized protein LOC18601917 n=1 Tax=Theobroma cacao TaxID=3641 RepID=A0AB32V9M1_THECC|nr:PREDICTED: uncharacterized protein LOC18601917 [Theobroma cacao]